MRVTLQKIADACQVSRNTVSLAMRNSPRISTAVREKIRQKAHEMGYVRDPELSQIMLRLSNRRKVDSVVKEEIACIYTIKKRGKPSHKEYIDEMTKYLQQHGYHLNTYYYDFTAKKARQLTRIFRTRGIRGIIITPLLHTNNRIELDFTSFSAVAIGRKLQSPALHRVDNNYPQSTRRCLQYLEKQGCRRVGCIVPSLFDAQINHGVRGAYLAWQSFLSQSATIPVLDYNLPIHRDLTVAMVVDWINQYQLDGIACFEFDLKTVEQAFAKLGKVLPVVLILKQKSEGYPGIVQDVLGVSLTTANILIGDIDHHRVGVPASPQLALIPGRWEEAN